MVIFYYFKSVLSKQDSECWVLHIALVPRENIKYSIGEIFNLS